MNIQKNSKAYWSLLKIFLNNKKILIIPPLFYENRYLTDFFKKAQLFNSLFSKQRSLNPNNSSLPAYFNYITDKRLYLQVHFQSEILEKSFKILIQTKHMDMITYIRMLNKCGDSICLPLEITFKQSLLAGVFPSEWKKKILFQFTKRATNNILKIIDQFLYFQFVVKYLKDLFLMKSLSIFPLINSSLKTSLVSNPVIPASINCYQLPTKFLHLLIMG